MSSKATSRRASLPALLLATWFGSGLLPIAPGTWGSLAALPFAWLLAWLGGPWLVLLGAALVFGAGLWAADRYMAAVGEHDPTAVVIDEVPGQWLAVAFAPLDPFAYALGFFLFRVADVLKPWPANWLDREVEGALGVMIDDVAAGLYAALGVWLIWSWIT